MVGRPSPFLIVLAALALVDFLAMPVREWAFRADRLEWALVTGGAGALLAQFGILPAWLVWGVRPYWQRLAIHWCSVAGLCLAWLLGFICTEPYWPIDEDLIAMAFVLPTISLAIEGPLWLTRLVFGWKLMPPGTVAGPERKLAIRDFLVSMAIVAVALTAVRRVMPTDRPDAAEFWYQIAGIATCGALASAVALPLMAWALLRLEKVRTGLAIVVIYWFVTYSLLATAGVMLSRPARPFEPLMAHLLLQAAFTVVIAASFLLLRRAGYRLQVGQRGPPLRGRTNLPQDDDGR